MAASTPARTTERTQFPRPAESLLVTGDDRLAEALAPLAAAAGHPLHRVTGPGDARSRWHRAPLVIVGTDAAEDCLAHGLPERRDLILCTTLPWTGADPTGTSMLWPLAIRLQADHVIAVPEATEWLLDRFTRTTRDTPPAPVVAAVAGHGGAGASTLALACATAAADDGRRVVLIDLDHTGGGIDTAAGLGSQAGWRWPSLATGTGQLEPERLLAGLPQRGGLHLVGPDSHDRTAPDTAALERVLHAARLGADLVLVDLPRTRTEAAARAATAATAIAVAIGESTRSWQAAHATVAQYDHCAPRIGTVLRSTAPRPARNTGTTDATTPPTWGHIPDNRRLPERLRRGRPPRGRTGRRLRELMNELLRHRTTGPDRTPALTGATR